MCAGTDSNLFQKLTPQQLQQKYYYTLFLLPFCNCYHADVRCDTNELFCFFRYLLQPKDNGSKSSKYDDLGSLRLSISYTEDYVLSSEFYSPLRSLLVKSPDVQVLNNTSHQDSRYYL